jgi:hypothetical protein
MSRARDTANQINRVNSSAADATAITVDSSENVGVGLTPSSWWSGMKAVETQASSGGVFASASVNGHFLTNAYYDGSNWKHKNNGAAEYYSQTGGIHQFLNVSSGSAGNNITWSERVRIDSDGLKFHGDTAAANALDDYEEGTWTPAPTVGSASSASGTYTKIGRMVVVTGFVSGMNTVNNETLSIAGLPFTGGNIAQCIGQAMWSNVDKDFGYEQVFYTGSSQFQFYHTTNANFDAIRHIDLDGSNSACYFSATYLV